METTFVEERKAAHPKAVRIIFFAKGKKDKNYTIEGYMCNILDTESGELVTDVNKLEITPKGITLCFDDSTEKSYDAEKYSLEVDTYHADTYQTPEEK